MEWEETEIFLTELRQDEQNVVEVKCDENGTVELIYVQLKQQKVLYKRFGELIHLDGTYKITKAGMPLYSILVQDNYGIGQPVCYFFVKNRSQDNILSALELFCRVSQIIFTVLHFCFFFFFKFV